MKPLRLIVPIFLILVVLLTQQREPSVVLAANPDAATILGTVQDDRIDEASGMVASRRNPGVLWIHNDSGDRARVYAVGLHGEALGEVRLNVIARDWEDIAIGPGPEDGVSYLYVGDIGDNERVFAHSVVYRFPEPALSDIPGDEPLIIDTFDKFEFVYPDGSHDVETLMVDPWNEDLYLVTKRDWPTIVYRSEGPQQPGTKRMVEEAATMNMTAISAGDISADGHHFLLRTYEHIYYWGRESNQTIAQVFEPKPVNMPYTHEPQGEAIAFSPDGTGYYTVSEELNGSSAQIAYYSFDPDSLNSKLKP